MTNPQTTAPSTYRRYEVSIQTPTGLLLLSDALHVDLDDAIAHADTVNVARWGTGSYARVLDRAKGRPVYTAEPAA